MLKLKNKTFGIFIYSIISLQACSSDFNSIAHKKVKSEKNSEPSELDFNQNIEENFTGSVSSQIGPNGSEQETSQSAQKNTKETEQKESPEILLAGGGSNIGNGGSGFYCNDDSEHPEVLLRDFYEAQSIWRLQIELNEEDNNDWVDENLKKNHLLNVALPNGVWTKYMWIMLKRWYTLDPVRGKKAIDTYKAFLLGSNTETIDSFELPDTDDIKQIGDKISCQKVTLALQKPKILTSQKKFILINKPLFEKLSDQDKAGLIMHEIIYYILGRSENDDSYAVRELNALLAANYFLKNNFSSENPDYYKNGFEYFRFLDHYNLNYQLVFNEEILNLTDFQQDDYQKMTISASLKAAQNINKKLPINISENARMVFYFSPNFVFNNSYLIKITDNVLKSEEIYIPSAIESPNKKEICFLSALSSQVIFGYANRSFKIVSNGPLELNCPNSLAPNAFHVSSLLINSQRELLKLKASSEIEHNFLAEVFSKNSLVVSDDEIIFSENLLENDISKENLDKESFDTNGNGVAESLGAFDTSGHKILVMLDSNFEQKKYYDHFTFNQALNINNYGPEANKGWQYNTTDTLEMDVIERPQLLDMKGIEERRACFYFSPNEVFSNKNGALCGYFSDSVREGKFFIPKLPEFSWRSITQEITDAALNDSDENGETNRGKFADILIINIAHSNIDLAEIEKILADISGDHLMDYIYSLHSSSEYLVYQSFKSPINRNLEMPNSGNFVSVNFRNYQFGKGQSSRITFMITKINSGAFVKIL